MCFEVQKSVQQEEYCLEPFSPFPVESYFCYFHVAGLNIAAKLFCFHTWRLYSKTQHVGTFIVYVAKSVIRQEMENHSFLTCFVTTRSQVP
jgi:hypothetical protein